jgi:hypothetical protein
MARGKPSRIDLLDEELRVAINSALRDGTPQATILERFNLVLEDRGEEPLSRSGLSRYATRVGKMDERMKMARHYADRLTSNLGEAARKTDLGRAASEMLKTLVFDKMLDAEGDEGDIEFDLGDLKSLSLTLKNIALASNLDLDRELKIMTEARKQALEDAANAVEEAAVEKGLDEEQARFWREKVLGVR